MRRSLLPLSVLILASCSVPAIRSPAPDASPPSPPPLPPPIAALSAPPAGWSLTGAATLYSRLYLSTSTGGDVLNLEERFARSLDDRIITAVAADLVVQFYREGTDPVGVFGEDLVVRRANDLVPLPPENLDLGRDQSGVPFAFSDLKEVVRGAAISKSPEEICADAELWWLQPGPLPAGGDREDFYPRCIGIVREIRRAVEHELHLRAFRQDLSLIAYGGEFVSDGQLTTTGSELRTYDLLLDIASVGNILGSGPFTPLFDRGNQGEQCDWERCPACLLPSPERCGNGAVTGAEQCDDGNRTAGDGCDEFCQVEGNYCGDGVSGPPDEPWEACDEGRECPDGSACGDYGDCPIGGNLCPYDAPDCEGFWQKTCRYDGAVCREDGDCACPPSLLPESSRACRIWRKDSCRYAFGGVCYRGGILDGTRCDNHSDCGGISRCRVYSIPPPPDPPKGFCANHPYHSCSADEDCFSCRFEEVWGTCYTTGETCNGDEDCPSDYCMLEPFNACRPRTRGGYDGAGTRSSVCNRFCEAPDATFPSVYCGDGVVYLDERGAIEECDDGMECADGTPCAQGESCADGSACTPRDARTRALTTCTAVCTMQVCGNGAVEPPEGCDSGARCIDGTVCDLTNPIACGGLGRCIGRNGVDAVFCNANLTPFCQDIAEPNDNPCRRDESCEARSDDGDGCTALCEREVCGDAVIQGSLSEECDDGNDVNDDACSNACRRAVCGDGIVQEGLSEECDGGPDCSDTCRREVCGNGVRDPGEECDGGADPTVGNSDFRPGACRTDCTRPRCGDGVRDPLGRDGAPETPDDEQCDGGNADDGDRCSSTCTLEKSPFCGNGELDSGEECDGGCDCSNCATGVCGDWIVNCDEDCDDGNADDGDGCSASCLHEVCGDGVAQAALGEECDTGGVCFDGTLCDVSLQNCPAVPLTCAGSGGACQTDADCGGAKCLFSRVCRGSGVLCRSDGDCPEGGTCIGGSPCLPRSCDGGGCSVQCREERCGNGIRECSEECDDGNALAGDGCSVSCLWEFCGDTVRQPLLGEECDDGWGNSDTVPDACRTNCAEAHCGDGVTDTGEECDDHNTGDGDGCSAVCLREAPVAVSLPVLPPINLCGDSYRETHEQCDDGNRADGDGCSASCTLERPDLCGNGVVDRLFGEECDQGHPYHTLECTPFCRLPHPAPMCGDGRKDRSGDRRGDTLEGLLTFSEGYRLDWRIPDGDQVLYAGVEVSDPGDGGRSAGGWYVTPRVFDRRLETPFLRAHDRGLESGRADRLDVPSCPLCGNGRLDPGEACDSGRLSGGSFPSPRANRAAWHRMLLSNAAGLVTGGAEMFREEHCSGTCAMQLCGNDRIEDGETCDDDNRDRFGRPQDGDGCSSRCKREAEFDSSVGVCGDDIVSGSEQCDDGGRCVYALPDGTKRLGGYCRFDTVDPDRVFCTGNDERPGTRDDGVCAVQGSDGCDAQCQVEPLGVCGNGRLEPYEQCDPAFPDDRCSGDCLLVPPLSVDTSVTLCGNGLLDEGETCDPPVSGQCSRWCLRLNVCGNTEIEGFEECDDGNDRGGDGCSAECLREYCGDGFVQTGLGEECDDGNTVNGDGCRNDCILPACGDDIVDSYAPIAEGVLYGEICDPGKHCSNDPALACADDWQCPIGPCDTAEGECVGDRSVRCADNGDCGYAACLVLDERDAAGNVLCTAQCTTLPTCGENGVEPGEECDDGNSSDGDGCSATCALEFPERCGNGRTEDGEACDDGNNADHDGCSGTCQREEMLCPADCHLDPDRPECVLACVFGFCGNGVVDAGEQCDDGRRCQEDPLQPCLTHGECDLLCLPVSGDGCSSTCMHERPPDDPAAVLALCQEEIIGGSPVRIGTGQTLAWKETLLDHLRNPFLRWPPLSDTRYLDRGGVPGQCTSGRFPNSAGNLVRFIASCLQHVALTAAIPDRHTIMPFEPVGELSYPACTEPRAKLVSAVEMPTMPAIEIPPYVPSRLAHDLQRIVCAGSGWPRRAFLFLCNEPADPTDPVKLSRFPDEGFAGLLSVYHLQRDRTQRSREVFLTHVLEAAVRASEAELSSYLREAVTALASSLDTARELFEALERTNFTTDVCPLDGTPLCPL